MGNLGAYLRPVPAGKTKEFYLENFKDEKGEKIPFVVKAITPKENDGIVKRNTVKGVFNNATYINEMIVTCMETPNLKDAELCSFYGVMDPTEVPGLMFTIGEKNLVMDAVSEINDVKKLLEGGDWETETSYFAFVSLGIFPEDFEKRPLREKILMFTMMDRLSKEMKNK